MFEGKTIADLFRDLSRLIVEVPDETRVVSANGSGVDFVFNPGIGPDPLLVVTERVKSPPPISPIRVQFTYDVAEKCVIASFSRLWRGELLEVQAKLDKDFSKALAKMGLVPNQLGVIEAGWLGEGHEQT